MSTSVSPAAADAVLVGCGKSRRPGGAPARDLYVSAYFARMRGYAERTGKPWFVLSARHGLVAPDTWLASDDCSLFTASRDYRRAWGLRVADQLEEALGPLPGLVLDVHAGAAYVRAADAALGPRGAVVLDQLQGLPIGRRLAWYLRQASAAPQRHAPARR